MSALDLTQSFKSLVESQSRITPRLKKDLSQVNVVLTGYARSRGLAGDKKSLAGKLSVFDICTDSKHLHPDLFQYIEALPEKKAYKGQNRTRIKKLVRQLPWESVGEKEIEGGPPSEPITLEKQLPEGLRPVWPLLSRVGHAKFRLPKRLGSDVSYERYSQMRANLTLTSKASELLNVLLKVYLDHGLQDLKTLLEEYEDQIRKTIKKQCPRSQWNVIDAQFKAVRTKARKFFSYSIEPSLVTRIPVDEFPEPLRSQVRLFKDLAKKGSMPDRLVKQRAKNEYKLDLGKKRSEETIKGYLEVLSTILGRIPRDMYRENLDVRDFLRLEIREVEEEGGLAKQLYNPLVDYVRNYEMNRPNNYKGPDADSGMFAAFVKAIAAVSAYNCFLVGRATFLKQYQVVLDKEARRERTQHKKEIFDRQWIDKQIECLSTEFNRIVDERLFMSEPDGNLSLQTREALNLCLFYVDLLTLRFLGVRQQCLRDCKEGFNIVFGTLKSITFEWLKTKNGKGIRHRLKLAEHRKTHGRLILDLWTFYKKVYPYLSGASESPETSELKERRRAAIGQQFFLHLTKEGLCVPFKDESHFSSWFNRQAIKYLDFEGRDPEGLINLNPHFFRGLCADWLHQDLGFSKKQAAEIVGNTEPVLEESYLQKIPVYDATEAWTGKNQELQAKEKAGQQETTQSAQDQLVKFLKESLEKAERERDEFKGLYEMAREEIAELRLQGARNHSELLAAIRGEDAGGVNTSGAIV